MRPDDKKTYTSVIDPAYIIHCWYNGYAFQYCGEYVTLGEVPIEIRKELTPLAYNIIGIEYNESEVFPKKPDIVKGQVSFEK